ncbi:cytochrome c1 family domain-containing protein [Ditylenchus destructor]|uniref:Cytochrome c1 family domain-containing protein n=1 Tax=Ditylenchus destructor TaxID=166010 RepID=A0AAD4QVM3_9BILA|nr:cytochrome c1 family domain-containing protein [Ditylenchus destructor]
MHRAGSKIFSLRNLAVGTGLTAATGAGAIIYALENAVEGGEFVCHAPDLPWTHSPLFGSLDIASVRRGYEVYKQVCAACHSMKYIKYRMFVDTIMTKDEAKAEAAEALIDDLDDEGKPIKRPGILTDGLPNPYPNAKAAAAANSGSAPPDLSLISLGRHGGENYIFSLLTSYMDPPAGVKVDEGKAYNPYFPGGVIAMPQQLFDEGVQYKDGTVATQSQQAKDVATFMVWTSQPWRDDSKRLALKLLVFTPFLTVMIIYAKRYTWTYVKHMKRAFVSVKGREPPPPST